MIIKELNKQNFEDEFPHYFENPEEYTLNEWAKNRLHELETAREIIGKQGTYSRSMPKIKEALSITTSKARALFYKARKLFSTPESNEGQAQISVQIVLDNIYKLRDMAISAGDLKALAESIKLELQVIDKYFGNNDAVNYQVKQVKNFILTAVPHGAAELQENWREDLGKFLPKEVMKRLDFETSVDPALEYTDYEELEVEPEPRTGANNTRPNEEHYNH